MWRDLRAQYGDLPVYVLAGVGVLVAAIFVYMSFFKPLSAEQYVSKAYGFAGQVQSVDTASSSSGALSGITSKDENDRIDAKAAWDEIEKNASAGIAGIRGLRPPAEYRTTQNRLLTGVAVYEQVLAATDAIFTKAVGGLDASPEATALSALVSDPALSESRAAFDTAYTRLEEDVQGGDEGTGE